MEMKKIFTFFIFSIFISFGVSAVSVSKDSIGNVAGNTNNVTTPAPPNSTTNHTPTTTTTTTTTTATPKPSPPPTTTTPTPNSTTTQPTTSTAPSTSTVKPTPVPTTTTFPPTTAAPPKPDRSFDLPSFVGGIILALGVLAIGYVVYKFYRARTDPNYRTL